MSEPMKCMRSAKQIFKGYKRLIDSEVSAYWCTEKDFIKAINEARIEAIKVCAEQYVPDGNPQVMRDKILSLIKEIK